MRARKAESGTFMHHATRRSATRSRVFESLVLAGISIGTVASMVAVAQPVPLVSPERHQPAPGSPFDFDRKTRKSLSGIACDTLLGGRRCLAVFDEGVEAQFATLGLVGLEPIGAPIELGLAGQELDAEGATTDGTYFYVVGSHAVKRKNCKSNPASRQLIRFKADPAIHASSANASAPPIKIESLQSTAGLWNLLTRDAVLGRHADGCLGSGKGGKSDQLAARPGIDIEGIAVYRGRLYFGFRAPSKAGRIPLYSVDAAAIFSGSDSVRGFDF